MLPPRRIGDKPVSQNEILWMMVLCKVEEVVFPMRKHALTVIFSHSIVVSHNIHTVPHQHFYILILSIISTFTRNGRRGCGTSFIRPAAVPWTIDRGCPLHLVLCTPDETSRLCRMTGFRRGSPRHRGS